MFYAKTLTHQKDLNSLRFPFFYYVTFMITNRYAISIQNVIKFYFSADFNFDVESEQDTFVLSNIVPQYPQFNRRGRITRLLL